MLAFGASNVDDQAAFALRELAKYAKKKGLTHDPPPFSAEVKLDGERLMAHVVAGEETRLFTRAGNDYSQTYGCGLGARCVACARCIV